MEKRNITTPPAIIGLIILLCIADMLDGGYSALFYVISILYIPAFFAYLDEINKYIANQRYLLCKGSDEIGL